MSDERFIHDDRFVEAFRNTDHVVYGRRLDPYCLWHHLNLEIAQSPVLLNDPLDPLSLLQAVTVCSTPWTPQHRAPDLTPPGSLKLLWLMRRYEFRAQLRKFQAFFNDYNSAPKLWPNSHKQYGEVQTVAERDFDQNLELALHTLKHGNLTWREVWTMPLGMLNWVSVGLAKLDGQNLSIWTPEHEEMFVEHKRKRELGIDARGREIAEATGTSFEAARKVAHDEHWAGVKQFYANNAEQPRTQ